jgi:hypothetical protein
VSPKLALSNLPDRNPFFTGREEVLAQMQEALAAQGRAALSGLGGVGKTQTAMEYAHRHFDNYLYTIWTIADSREALVSGYVTVARLLKLPEVDSPGSDARGGSRQALVRLAPGLAAHPRQLR